MSSGVPAGATIGSQPSSAKIGSLWPCSVKVGTSGSRGERRWPTTAIGRTVPRSMCVFIAWKLPSPPLTWPDATSTHIGGSPL